MNAALKQEILEYLQQQDDLEELVRKDCRWGVLYYLSEMRRNLLEWYAFRPESTVLELGAECGALSVMFSEKVKRVVCCEEHPDKLDVLRERCKKLENVEICRSLYPEFEMKADYIVIYGSLLKDRSLKSILRECRRFEKEDTVVILAMDNRMGLRNWNGAAESTGGKYFSGLMDFSGSDQKNSFTRKELEKTLRQEGLDQLQFYYPMPDYQIPVNIYSDRHLPQAGELRNVTFTFSSDRYEMFREEPVYDTICEDGMFPYFANSFLVFANAQEDPAEYIRINRQRRADFQTCTKILRFGDKKITEKRSLTDTACAHLRRFAENQSVLEETYPNLKVLAAEKLEDGLYYDFLENNTVEYYLGQEKEFSWKFMEKTRELIWKIFEVSEDKICTFEPSERFRRVFGDVSYEGAAVRNANVDMALDNIVMVGEHLVMIDYEWVFPFPVPKNYSMYRGLSFFFDRNDSFFKRKLDKESFMQYMGISSDEIPVFEEMERQFQKYVRGTELEYSYLENYKKKIIPFDEYEKVVENSRLKDRAIEELNRIIHGNNDYIAGLEQLIEKYHNNPAYKLMDGVRKIIR